MNVRTLAQLAEQLDGASQEINGRTLALVDVPAAVGLMEVLATNGFDLGFPLANLAEDAPRTWRIDHDPHQAVADLIEHAAYLFSAAQRFLAQAIEQLNTRASE